MLSPAHKLKMVLLAAALLGVAAVAGTSLPGSAQAPATLKIATTPTDIGSQVFYAQDKGFFKANGLDAQIQVISNGAAITAAVMSGALDIAQSNIASLAAAHEAGLDIVIVAPAGSYSSKEPTTALIVAKNSPIKTAKDLNGKTIATTAIRDSSSLTTIAWLDENGADSSTVQLVEIPYPAMPAAVQRGTVAAAPIAEPALSAAMKTGSIRIIGHPMDAYGKQFMVGGWFARPDFIVANAALIRRLRATAYSTATWANAHPDETAAILAKYSKMDPDVVRTMNRAPYLTSLTPDLLQSYLDLGYKYKYIGKQLKAADLIAKV